MLVEQYIVEVFRLAAAIVDAEAARDVTQETFLAAWSQLARLRRPDSFPGWLRRICVNQCRNWLRTTRRRPRGPSLDEDPERARRVPDATPDFRGAVEARLVLAPAFERLSADQRTVLGLHYSMGLSLSETAEAMGVSVGTAKSRLSAGLRVLREAIGGDADRQPPLPHGADR